MNTGSLKWGRLGLRAVIRCIRERMCSYMGKSPKQSTPHCTGLCGAVKFFVFCVCETLKKCLLPRNSYSCSPTYGRRNLVVPYRACLGLQYQYALRGMRLAGEQLRSSSLSLSVTSHSEVRRAKSVSDHTSIDYTTKAVYM